METTQPVNEVYSLDQAAEMLVQPEEQLEEVVEEVEVEDEQPAEDSYDDAETDDETEEADDIEEEDVDAEDDEEYEEDSEESDVENEDSDESEEVSDDPLDKLYTVPVDGVDTEVPLRELLRDYSGQKFIQKGMQENAQLKKQAEQTYVALTQERQQLQDLIQQVQSGALTPPAAPNMEQFRDDPFGWHEAQMDYANKLQAYNEQVGQVTQQLEKQSEADMQLRKQYAQAEAQELVRKMPELEDPQKAKAFSDNLTKAAEQFGYTPEEIGMISSHRDMMVLHAASKWLEMQQGDSKKIVAEKSKKARKPIKAGAKKTVSKSMQERQRLKKARQSNNADDVVNWLVNPNLK